MALIAEVAIDLKLTLDDRYSLDRVVGAHEELSGIVRPIALAVLRLITSFVLRRLLNGQVCGFFAIEDLST